MNGAINLLKTEIKTYFKYFLIFAGISIVLGSIFGSMTKGSNTYLENIRASIGGLLFISCLSLLLASATESLIKTNRLGIQFSSTRKDIILATFLKDILGIIIFGLIAYGVLYYLMPRPIDQSRVFFVTRVVYEKFSFTSLGELLLYFTLILSLINIIPMIFYVLKFKDTLIYGLQGASGYLVISLGNFIQNIPNSPIITLTIFVLVQIIRAIIIKKVDRY
ncbi:hypothetical protein [uncultured Anaerococcus sp.]|uniref:hypothetical protein n=1 Tax=uncultured Anaerococcus sp. TaxID=293428 RepID=UPI002618E993|nr:hypothetical protein [uncultured Anaerococcus sp.]